MAIHRAAVLGLLGAAIPLSSLAQSNTGTHDKQAKPDAGAQKPAGMHPVQVDAQNRPITMGGFVKSGPVVFEDASQKAGLSKWTYKMGTPAKTYIVERVFAAVVVASAAVLECGRT